MEEKIVILGNGFDLRHFLPTKYNHLITILREIENLDFLNFDEISFDDLFGNLFKEKDEWFFSQICEFYDVENIKFDIKSLESIQNRLKNNNWYKYLKTVEDSKIETWIDFEAEIERASGNISSYFTSFNDGKFGKIERQYIGGTIYYQINKNFEYNFFKNKLQRNILSEFGLFNIEQFSNYHVLEISNVVLIDNEIQYFKEKDFFDSIYNLLEDFIGIFNDYIIYVVNVFYPNLKENKKEDFITLKDSILFDKIDKIFSFNYTKTFSELYKLSSVSYNDTHEFTKLKKTSQEFIHGKAIDKWKELDQLKIVLGVDEIDSVLKNHKLFQFTKYFQKLHKNTDYLFLHSIIKDLKSPYKGRQNYTFYFWGHSLDSSDSNYIREVFEVVGKGDNQIKIFYHSISAKADQLKNLLNIIDKNIIENLIKDKILVFLEATSDNLFKEL